MNKAQETFRKNLNDDAVVPIKEATKNQGEFTQPYSIGYIPIDDAIMGGVREGDLIIGTGLSGSGKTTLWQNILVNLSRQGNACLYFSYEVILDNLYAKFKQMGAEENLKAYTPKYNTSGNLKWIQEKIKEGIEKYNTKFIFIDHIDYLTPAKISNSDQRRIILRDICQELKNMAIELKIIVFLIAHVKKVQGRAVEMQDISEASGIYQLADLVLVAEREMVSRENLGRKVDIFGDKSMIRILKNRMTGEYAEMEFILRDNIIIPEGSEPQDLSLFNKDEPEIIVEDIEPEEIKTSEIQF